jgi:ABC-type proline/glycine betaine transport system ATPase subunit
MVQTLLTAEGGAAGRGFTPPGEVELETRELSVFYGPVEAVKKVSIVVPDRQVVAFIGPSGCGKSTLLRCFNRMNDLVPGARIEGRALFQGRDLYGEDVDPVEVRRRIGMVFQKPNPFPKSIYDNVAYGPRIHGLARSKDPRILLDPLFGPAGNHVNDLLHGGMPMKRMPVSRFHFDTDQDELLTACNIRPGYPVM